MDKLPKEQNKECNIPCIFGKNKKQLVKISQEKKFKIDEKLKLPEYKHQLLLKFANKAKFIYSVIDSRKYLEEIIPCFPEPMLFLGWAKYTKDYSKICKMVSVDYNKGVKPDIVADITTDRFVAEVKKKHKAYKSLIINGVIGWGVNKSADIHKALVNCKKVMAPGGYMLMGWNAMPFEGKDADTTITIPMMKKYLKKYFKDIKLIYNKKDDEWNHKYIICRK
jgi:hypothetical protein